MRVERVRWGICLIILIIPSALAADLYVPSDQYPTIQAAVNAASPGDRIYVAPGTYKEAVVISKSNITLLSTGGKQDTTIEAPDPSTNAITIQGTTTGVQIGAVGQGFTIKGTDSPNPGIEYAAIYIKGTHSNLKIIGNEIVADGEAGLLVEYGASINGMEVSHCVFSGKTFVGDNPAGNGFEQQFTLWNVPRALFYVSGPNKSNITFTYNQVLGVAGGLNPQGQEQGNTLVTIDADGVNVAHNYFAGNTSRAWSASLRVRGKNNVIEYNTFDFGPLLKLHIFAGPTGDTTIRYNNFAKPADRDIGAILNVSTAVTVEAPCNWWGDPTGPKNSALNPNGRGCTLAGTALNGAGLFTLGQDNRQWWTAANGPCAYHYFLTVAEPYPQNGGIVQPAVGGPYPYAEGTGAEVIATPNQGFAFVEWQEKIDGQWVSINGQATHRITMNKDRTIRALFLPARYSLRVTVQPTGGGTVTVTPNPGTDGKYAAGTPVTLTVNPAAGFRFVRWDGPNRGEVTGAFPTYGIVMDGDKSVTAVFDRIPIFSEDFEGDMQARGWTMTGLWHIRTAPPCITCTPSGISGAHAQYSKSGTCTYDTGSRTMGILNSPEIRIPKNATLALQFDFARHVEYNTRIFRDQTYVQVRFGFVRVVSGREYVSWTGWATIWIRSSRGPSPECGTFIYNFRTWSYERMQVRFVFDSLDHMANDFPGWAIDNVLVKPAGTLQPGALEVADIGPGWEDTKTITVMNTPNPVRDVHTTTFTVFGVEAETVRVEVYDLTGRLVWRAEAPGNELIWHTEDLTGIPLANGVYVYIAYVKIDGEWIKLEPQKLVILR